MVSTSKTSFYSSPIAVKLCRNNLSNLHIILIFTHFSHKQSVSKNNPDFGTELCVKLSTEQWVIGKQVDQREVYIIVSTKNSNLIEIMEEVDKLLSKEFRNVCLLEK